jgi:valyl-tRNA synthetase
VNQALSAYRFDDAANLIYQFFWGEFCDWYLEIVKIRLDFSETADKTVTTAALNTLLSTFETALRLLSPFMPFLTEEIWQALYDGKPPQKSISLSQYPRYDASENQAVRWNMVNLQNIIKAVRTRRKELDVEEKALVPVKIITASIGTFHDGNVIETPIDKSFIENNLDIIQRLARVSTVEPVDINDAEPGRKHGNLPWYSAALIRIYIDYEKQIDIPAERDRLTKDLAKYEKEMQSKQSQLQNEAFLAKAPTKVVDGLRTRANELTVLIEKTRAALDSLDAVGSR